MLATISTASNTKIVPGVKWLLAAMLLAGCASFLTACNTVEGAGKDIERAGEGVQDAAD